MPQTVATLKDTFFGVSGWSERRAMVMTPRRTPTVSHREKKTYSRPSPIRESLPHSSRVCGLGKRAALTHRCSGCFRLALQPARRERAGL